MPALIDKDSPEVIELDRQISEVDAERIVLEAAIETSKPEMRRVRTELASLYDQRHKLLHQPDNPDDVL